MPFEEFEELFDLADPPEIGSERRISAKSSDQIEGDLRTISRSGIAAEKMDLLKALLFLWHDHLEKAHEIVQSEDDRTSAWIHGIVHRREPDYSNAKYWFRRVGQHPGFEPLAREVSRLLDREAKSRLAGELLPRGCWDSFAFVDACESATRRRSGDDDVLRRIQALEFNTLKSAILTA